jgi:hypothetical protein
MVVLFGYSADYSKVTSIFYADEDGVVVQKTLRSDGTVKERRHPHETLAEVMKDLGRSLSPLYAAEVDDLRSAFKYLGKAADLVSLLPGADLDDHDDGQSDTSAS